MKHDFTIARRDQRQEVIRTSLKFIQRQVVIRTSLKPRYFTIERRDQSQSVVRTLSRVYGRSEGTLGAHIVPQTSVTTFFQGILRSQEEIRDRKSLGLVSNLFRDR